ncbi:MAG: ThiF family adenylyltransferase [Thaumarchaeota archaeon]|nr:ThiF family adenylyltransferase [Nitrososphaerota archaeon]
MPEGASLTESELSRYSRHLVLPEVGTEGQLRLKGSSALVVGCGGLGTPAAVYLASAGVGMIGLVDGDVVELPNLQRQFLYSEADMGRSKAHVLKERLHQVNPNVRAVPYALKLDSGNALDLIGEYDVVIDATDNLPARYLVNDACVLLGKPDVHASALGFGGQISVFHPPGGPCYRCLYPEPPSPEHVASCEEAGVMGVVPGVLGTLQANQAIGLLLGKGSQLIGRLLVFNGFDSSFDEVRVKRDVGCRLCGANPTITSLIDYDEFCGTRGQRGTDVSPPELKSMMSKGEELLLLDVREPREYSLCHLDGAKLMPLETLPRKLAELDRAKTIVVYCHVGVRSGAAVSYLRKEGFHALNLEGGIDAWAVQVDQTTPRY